MRVEVYKKWVIRSDERNIILGKTLGEKERKGKDGTMEKYEAFGNETYHGTIKQALDTLCEKEIYACKATTFIELTLEYKNLGDMLEDVSARIKYGLDDALGTF